MRNKVEYKKIVWIDIEKPQPSDTEFLREQFQFNPLDLEEINRPTYRPKAEDHGNYIFIVLHFPIYNPKKKTTVAAELEFFLTKTHLISVHSSAIPPLQTAFEGCCNHSSVVQRYMEKTTGHLLYYLVERLFESCFSKLDNIAEKINKIEDKIFQGKEKEMVKEISIIHRDILDFRRTLKPQEATLESLATMKSSILNGKLQIYFRDTIGSNIRAWNTLENHKETIEVLKSTNESLLSNKISEIMKTLTIVSFLTFPLSVIAGFFGMNVFDGAGYISHPFAPLAILGIMIATTLLMLIYFKAKKWL
ncbi:MAG: magnesium transporter CorA family protein [bacterium]